MIDRRRLNSSRRMLGISIALVFAALVGLAVFDSRVELLLLAAAGLLLIIGFAGGPASNEVRTAWRSRGEV